MSIRFPNRQVGSKDMPDEIVDETEPELEEGFFLPLSLKYEYVTGEHGLLSVRVSPTSFGLTASGADHR